VVSGTFGYFLKFGVIFRIPYFYSTLVVELKVPWRYTLPMGVDTSVHGRIKQIRLALGLSQAKFSKGILLKSSGYYGDIELGKVEANPRIIELVSSIYGANKQWILTGQGKMFDTQPDKVTQEMNILFSQLNPAFKRYVLEQIKSLLKLQNEKSK
jgi:transcriptional regulator with XRE-family HTH domain